MVAWTELDLSTAEFPGGYGAYDGTAIYSVSGGYPDFRFPGLALDPSTTYAIQVDYDTARSTDTGLFVYSQRPDDDTSASNWYDLGSLQPQDIQPRIALTIGPGIASWASAVAASESHVMFEGTPGVYITGLRIAAVDPARFTTGPWRDDANLTWLRAGGASAGRTSGGVSYNGQTQDASGSAAGLPADWAPEFEAAWSATSDDTTGASANTYAGDQNAPYLRNASTANELIEWRQTWTTLVAADKTATDSTLPDEVLASEFDSVVGVEWEPTSTPLGQRLTLGFGPDVLNHGQNPGDVYFVHMAAQYPGSSPYMPGPLSAAAVSSMARIGTVVAGSAATVVTSGIPLPLTGTNALPLTILDSWTETQTVPPNDGTWGTIVYSLAANLDRSYRPRYRLITIATHAPPLRQCPRSDGLGASSARRLWPLSPSIQASNRKVGGYL